MKSVMPLLIAFLLSYASNAQTASVSGTVTLENKPIPFASLVLAGTSFGTLTDSLGNFSIKCIPLGNYTILVTTVGCDDFEKTIALKTNGKLTLNISLSPNNRSLNEVVVTGVSKATLIRENPIAIESVSSKQIEQTNESNIIDVLVKNVPGLNAVKTGANISKPFIRGLGYNRVLTLYDGIRQEGQQWGDEHGIEVDAYNISRAEVIKGPASLMYGSDALAGVVSLFPFIPNYDDKKIHGRFISEYQTNNNLIGNGLRLGYCSKHFLFAARGSYRIAKDYRNPIDGRVYLSNFDEKNFSALLGYKTGKGFSHFNITWYDNRQAIPDGSRDSITRKFTKQIYEGDQDVIKDRPIVPNEELNSYKLPSLSQHIQHYRMYMQHYYQLGNGDIDFLLGFQQNIRREYNHPSMPAQAGMYVRLNTLNYGLRYNLPKFSNIETAIGINGMLQNNKSMNATDFPIPDYHLYDGGIYVYAKWRYNKWSISGGLRNDMRHVQWNDFYVKTNPSTGFDEHVNTADTANSILQFAAYQKTFQGMSASAGLTFKASNQISLKANIGRAYRAPNITEMGSNGLDPGAHIVYLGNKNFSPEFSLQEDIVASARFKNFSTDLSVFNNNIQNYIYLNLVTDGEGNAIVDAQGNKTYQYQQARAQLYGAEIWFAIHPEKLNGFRFDNSLALVYGFNRKVRYKHKGVDGEYLPLIPPLKLLSSVSQKIQPSSRYFTSLTPKIEMEFSAAQNRFMGLNNTETATPAYVLFNCGIVTVIKYSKTQTVQFQLQINNLLDKAYQSNLSRLKYFEYYTASANGHLGIYNMGRNACFKVIFPF
ncbi:MAG: TonB-dependent receptor [Bacteroidetes bacterium]|nr:TonB-dependent receptor [Bacteroidota bacterium]